MTRFTAVAAIVLAALVSSATAQTEPSFTGKWEGTFTIQGSDQSEPRPIFFDLTQNGKEITGTAGPANQQEKIANGAVAKGKATFDVPLPSGAVFKFELTIVKGRLQGDMMRERNGQVDGRAKVDAGRAAEKK